MTENVRKTKKVNLYAITDELDGTIDEAIAYLQNLKAEQPELRLEYDDLNHYGSDRYGLQFYVRREDTDEEMANRVAMEEAWQNKLRDQRRAEFERLQAEFVGETK